jgi:exodeoxyribonuclease-5
VHGEGVAVVEFVVPGAQGSQWDDVVLIDESRCFRGDRARWLYTGITRASQRVTVVTR